MPPRRKRKIKQQCGNGGKGLAMTKKSFKREKVDQSGVNKSPVDNVIMSTLGQLEGNSAPG